MGLQGIPLSAPDRIRNCDLRFRSSTVGLVNRRRLGAATTTAALHGKRHSAERYCVGDVGGERGGRAEIDRCFQSGRPRCLVGLSSPEVAWESLPLVGFRDVYRGRSGAREWLEQLLEVFEEARLEIEETTALSDDRVLTGYTQIGRGRGSGLPENCAPGRSSGSRRT